MTVYVAAAVVRHEGKILLTQRPNASHLAGYWEFPGGKIEDGEAPRAAVVRECQEECGIQIEAGEIVEVVFHAYPKKSVVLLFFECRLISGEVQHLGVSDHRWVVPSELETYKLPPADLPLVRKLTVKSRI